MHPPVSRSGRIAFDCRSRDCPTRNRRLSREVPSRPKKAFRTHPPRPGVPAPPGAARRHPEALPVCSVMVFRTFSRGAVSLSVTRAGLMDSLALASSSRSRTRRTACLIEAFGSNSGGGSIGRICGPASNKALSAAARSRKVSASKRRICSAIHCLQSVACVGGASAFPKFGKSRNPTKGRRINHGDTKSTLMKSFAVFDNLKFALHGNLPLAPSAFAPCPCFQFRKLRNARPAQLVRYRLPGRNFLRLKEAAAVPL